MIAILIPVLGRPHRVAPLVESILAASKVTACTPYFLVSPNDELEMVAVDETPGAVLQVMPFEHGPGDYARKMNWGFANTSEPFVFLAADDLRFLPGWAERAVACWYETNACVVGTNDLGSQRVQSGQHSTHTLVSREYGECGTIDDEKRLLHEGYFHNFVDDEFVQTASYRGTYAQALDCRVEHLHPNWGKAKTDRTYSIGQQHFADDRVLYNKRRALWGGTAR